MGLATALLVGCSDPAPGASDAAPTDLGSERIDAGGADVDTPTLDAPVADVPLVDRPGVDVPLVDRPDVDVTLVDRPDVDVPAADVPPADVPSDLGAVACATAAACDDHEACTVDACAGGFCQHATLADGVDCGVATASACAAGVCTAGAALRPPWRTRSCTLWSRVPPSQSYLAPLATAEGIFAPSADWLMMMHRAASWTMERFPAPSNTAAQGGFVALVAGPGWIAGVGNRDAARSSNPTGLGVVFMRQDGRWTDVTPDAVRRLRLAGAWSTGAVLYVSTTSGRVFAREGAAWRELAGATGVEGYGAPTSLYLLSRDALLNTSLSRYDGARATAMATPRIGEMRALGGLSADEVYALGDRLYRVTGTTLAAAPDVDCGGGTAPAYERLVDAPGQLAVVVTCGSERRAFRRVGGAWVAAGTLPSGLSAALYRVAVSEDGRLHLADSDHLWQYAGGAWTQLPEDAPPVPGRDLFNSPFGTVPIVGSPAGSVTALGARSSRLVVDHWEDSALPTGLSVKTAWAAPDGTIFALSEGSLPGVWRFAAGAWTRDITTTAGDAAASSNVIGRSSSDVYVAYGFGDAQRIRHWDGTTWQTVTSPCGGPDQFGVARLALAGPRVLIAYCNVRLVNYSPYQRDGDGGWGQVLPFSTTRLVGFLTTLGPAATPTALLALNFPGEYQVRNEVGWVARSFPGGVDTTGLYYTFNVVPGSLTNRVVSTNGFAYTDGTTWTGLGDWLADFAVATEDAWTDGRWVTSPAVLPTSGTPDPRSGSQASRRAVVRCDLGSAP